MKAKQLFLISALAMVGFTACEKDLYDPNQNQPDKKVTDLIIPDGFDWQMTKATTCNVTSDHSAQLSIYLDEARTQGNLLATVSVQAGSNINLPLSILKDTKNVYVEYETADGKKAFVVAPVDANGNISFVAPADSKKVTTRTDNFPDRNGVLYYPKGSEGTVMFEDNYPTLGDYDFNDFVAYYIAEIKIESDDNKRTFIKEIEFRLEVKAIGGVDAYIPCLRLPFNENLISKAVAKVSKESNNTINLIQTTDASVKANIVFILDGAEKNNSKNSGSQFLNTEEGFKTEVINTVILTITFNEKEALLSDLTSNLFDIFLCKSDKSKEIHMLGYGPAFEKGGNIDETDGSYLYNPKNTYYQSEKGFVWAISIPDGKTGHALEKANFIDAYPLFAAWAQSGGTSNTEWYHESKNDYLFEKKLK